MEVALIFLLFTWRASRVIAGSFGGRRELVMGGLSPIFSATLSKDVPGCDLVGTNFFSVDLVVLPHLYFFVQPQGAAVSDGCRPFLIHAASDESANNVKAAVPLPNGFPDLEEVGYSASHGSMIDFGAYSLDRIAAAYASASVSGEEESTYDYFSNNCGDFLANILKELDFEANGETTNIIGSLIAYEAPPELTQHIRAAADGTEHGALVASMTDAELFRWMVQIRLAGSDQTLDTKATADCPDPGAKSPAAPVGAAGVLSKVLGTGLLVFGAWNF